MIITSTYPARCKHCKYCQYDFDSKRTQYKCAVKQKHIRLKDMACEDFKLIGA